MAVRNQHTLLSSDPVLLCVTAFPLQSILIASHWMVAPHCTLRVVCITHARVTLAHREWLKGEHDVVVTVATHILLQLLAQFACFPLHYALEDLSGPTAATAAASFAFLSLPLTQLRMTA